MASLSTPNASTTKCSPSWSPAPVCPPPPRTAPPGTWAGLPPNASRQRTGLAVVPGIEELLDRLCAANVPICVASSGTPDEIALRLALTGLDRFFGDHCYSASMVPRGKPAPDLFLLAAGSIGVHPTGCVVIEDSPYGVRGGKAAGMTVVGYAALASPRTLRRAGADYIITEMADAAALLGLRTANTSS